MPGGKFTWSTWLGSSSNLRFFWLELRFRPGGAVPAAHNPDREPWVWTHTASRPCLRPATVVSTQVVSPGAAHICFLVEHELDRRDRALGVVVRYGRHQRYRLQLPLSMPPPPPPPLLVFD